MTEGPAAFGRTALPSSDTVHLASKPTLSHGSSCKFKVEATADQVNSTPKGNLIHRLWQCGSEWVRELRNMWAPAGDVRITTTCDVGGHPLWERGLMPRPTKPMKAAAKEDTFKWVLEPPGGVIEGTAYTDGSYLEGPTPELGRCGWSFVVLNDLSLIHI